MDYEYNYFIINYNKMMSKKLTYIHHGIINAIYLSLAIRLEFLYHDPLFTHSLTWEKEWQSKGSKSLENFFKILTQFGTQAELMLENRSNFFCISSSTFFIYLLSFIQISFISSKRND